MSEKAANNLFHRRTLNLILQNYAFPADFEQRHEKILSWVQTLDSGTLDKVKETSLHGDFLKDIFQEVLGYRSVIGGKGERWELHAEQTISDGGGSADGALGFFEAKEGKKGSVKLKGKVIAPIELKGVKNNLDRPAPGRKESAVDQGWRYANYTPDCKWVIVSNYREIRLYHTNKTPAFYERFSLKGLEDLEQFKKFYFLLCSQNFLPLYGKQDKPSRIDKFLRDSDKAEEEVSEKLYAKYKLVRIDLVQSFRTHGPRELENRDQVLIEKAQKVLDRILFVAFCEDRELLPKRTLIKAHDHKDPYNPRTIWENYKAVFRSVDKGNPELQIAGYNGGLFRHDELLDGELTVSDDICTQLKDLSTYDFNTEVSVDILGHIFEQSVTDLEQLKARAQGEEFNKKKGKRKKQGIFYTPEFITQYIVKIALGGYLERQKEALPEYQAMEEIPDRNTAQKANAAEKFWEAYRDRVLQQVRVVDPACGSGAFLIAAFDYLVQQYDEVNGALADLQGRSGKKSDSAGQRSLFDLNKTILNQNLYGVDLSPGSVEITKLSLWLKTAERGKQLTSLDDNIRVGNSIVSDPEVDAYAFDWKAAFPDVFTSGGFDVVIGNPPYVRQELLTPYKPYLQGNYATYDGVADIYVYFYEKGLEILRPNGVFSYIVTNKWLRAGYGEPLRKFFSESSVFEQIIDFGHAPIFEEADVFPCIVSARKPIKNGIISAQSKSVQVCSVHRDHLKNINLPQYTNQEGHTLPWSKFSKDEWSLERLEVESLLIKLKESGTSLKDFTKTKPYYGIKTGLNEVFLIDESQKRSLVQDDPESIEIIKPYLRGQDLKRWSADWNNLWMIFSRRGIDIEKYPAVKHYLLEHQARLEPKPKGWQGKKWPGRKAGSYKWYEVQDPVDYWNLFNDPKIIIQRIAFHPRITFDESGFFINDSAIIIPVKDFWTLACMNSPIIWYYCFKTFPHKKDEALAMDIPYVEALPIAEPTDAIRAEVEPAVQSLIEITRNNKEATQDTLDWLRLEHNIEKPGKKLSSFALLSLEDFQKEVKKRRPKGSGSIGPKALKELREAYNDYAPAIQTRRAEALQLEHRISDLVNQAYGLTPEEIDLMWKTAPPRMPISRYLPGQSIN